MSEALTIVLAAKNAGATIARAIRSCQREGQCPIVLVDDHSQDDTVERAREAAAAGLRVIATPEPGGVAEARQAGLEAVTTRFAAWLDADDEWVAGRAQRLVAMLDDGHDVATEAIDLFDGPSDTWLRTISVPACLRPPGASVRLFERNLLPGDTQVAFRVEAFRQAGGYDRAIFGPESFDLLLRVLRRGGRVAFGDEAGYRMYAYPGSVSRNLPRQRAALRLALRKHAYPDVARMYLDAGYHARITAWALVMLAAFRDEPALALRYLEEACPPGSPVDEVLEPDGPWPQPEGWRRAFQRGSLLLQLNADPALAVAELSGAEAIDPTPEGANNLGVGLWRLGRFDLAAASFALAASRLPGYHDANQNTGAHAPSCVTTHPLRRAACRSDYVPVDPAEPGGSGNRLPQ